MPKINLARALKEKKRIISRIQEIVSCRHENVYEKDEAPQLDLRCKADEMRFLKGLLVNLKTHIAKANAEKGICERVYEMEELKQELQFFERLDTTTTPRKERNPMTGEIKLIPRMAFFSFEEVENIKRDIKTRLNELQDEIDEINGSTFIEYEADLIK